MKILGRFVVLALLASVSLRASYDFPNAGDFLKCQVAVCSDLPAVGSLSLWLKSNADLSSAYAAFVDNRNAGPTNLFGVVLFSGSWYAGWMTASTDYRVATASCLPSNGVWTNVVLTWDDTTTNETKFYVNGSQCGSTSTSLATYSTTANDTLIGNDANAAGNANSKIAYLAIWNAVISGATITGLQTCDPSHYLTNQTHAYSLLTDANDGVGSENMTVTGAALSSGDGPTLSCGGGGGPSTRARMLMLGIGQ